MNTSSMVNPSAHSVDEAPAPQFAIAVSATLQQRRTRTLKHGDTFAVFDHRGDIGGEPGNPEGLYHRDTRMLSQLQLLLEEARAAAALLDDAGRQRRVHGGPQQSGSA